MHDSIKLKLNELEDIKKLSQKYFDLEISEGRFISRSWISSCNLFKINYSGCSGFHYLNLFFIDTDTQKEIHSFKICEFHFDKKNDCVNNLIGRLEKLNVSESLIIQIIKELYNSCQ